MDARLRVQYSLDACRCWSLQYDGKIPDPKLFRSLESSSSSSCSSSAGSGTGIMLPNISNAHHPPSLPEEGAVMEEDAGMDLEDEQSANFLRQAAFRKSKTNRYYNVRHSSLLAGGHSHLNNLALGDDDYGSQLRPVETDPEHEIVRQNSTAGSTPDSGPSSTLSTPR